MYKIIIVEDHKMFRESIGYILSKEGVAKIIAQAGNGKEFLELMDNHNPDVVLMDIAMPIMDGIETATKALEKNPALNILTLSSFGEEKYYHKMIEAGVKGFLLKDADVMELQQAIDTVAKGGTWFSNELLRRVITSISKKKKIDFELTDRELDVLKLICQGLTNEQIAEQINLSYDTVRWHRSNIFSKTGCNNSASLVMFAIKNSVIEI